MFLATQTEKKPQPVFPRESAAGWAKIRAAAEKGNEKQLRELLLDAELSVKLAGLFIAAVSEAAELEAIVKAGEGQAVKRDAAGRRIRELVGYQAKTIEEVKTIAEERATKLEAEYHVADRLASAAERAPTGWLYVFLSELFGKAKPPHSGFLGALIASPKTFAVLADLDAAAAAYNLDGWRSIGTVQQSQAELRRKRFTSFGAVQQSQSSIRR